MHKNNVKRENKYYNGAKLPTIIKVFENNIDIHFNNNPYGHLCAISEAFIEQKKKI